MERTWRGVPDGLQRLAGVTPRRGVDAVLDISGFAYGDFWPMEKIEDRLLSTIAERRGGRPRLILLPQAYGPFEEPAKADAMRRAIAGADLVYVRDDVSLDHVRKLGSNADDRIRRAPDFTNLLEAGNGDAASGTSYVIPNSKMIQSADPGSAEAYYRFLEFAVMRLRVRFPDVTLLIHEGERDVAVARQLNERLPVPAPVVVPETAHDTKALIAGACCVVSSRFHGLVSALSSGVPALACGWTHKYGELMRDYGLEAMMVDPEQPDDWERKLAQLADLAQNGREPLLQRAQDWKAATRAMWQDVFDCIAQEVEPSPGG